MKLMKAQIYRISLRVVSQSCCAHEKLCFQSLFCNTLVTNSISTLQNNLLPSGETTANGNSVVIQDVSRHHSGIYICTADNQVGSPAKAEIDLKVLCKFLFFHPSIKKITRKRQTTTFKKEAVSFVLRIYTGVKGFRIQVLESV